MALADFTTYLGRLATSPITAIHGKSSIANVIGRGKSLWAVSGSEQGVVPTTHVACTKATLGAVVFPGGAYLAQIDVAWSTGGSLSIADRLVAGGNLVGDSVSVQSLAAVAAPPRYATGDGVRAAVEIYTQIGSTTRELAVTYTNQAGTGSRAGTCTVGSLGTKEVGAVVPIRLQAGDSGVRSVESVQLPGTTGGTGNFGITLYKPLLIVPVLYSNVRINVFIGGGGSLPAIDPNACLWFIAYTNTTSTDDIVIELTMIDE